MLDLIWSIFADGSKPIGNWILRIFNSFHNVEEDSLASQWIGFTLLVLLVSALITSLVLFIK